MTNEKIVKALQTKFGLNVYYAEVPEQEENIYNYFYFIENKLETNGVKFLTQTVMVAYVSENEDSLKELEIIDCLEDIKLHFDHAEYSRVQRQDTNNFVDMVMFYFTRPLKKVKCY